ncbi:Putative CopG family transcriptional regulator [Candidatus Trichorickettsia mobilis]|jgi:predicted transcriptional regulator|uniref:CopG family transcriptional regulator n=1 Tax=Candidatus Trichorickettsia mobilis TaxID=1346319 RepID=A0ABZ0UWB1_9RICK|nr:ribbon-helix-helix protein, CopG family [Candidatus Trichorickettsia mobilis]WPY01283.1 Putative CopG family transcriptional regulator [Candidatus Trichorickettsia mobilis]
MKASNIVPVTVKLESNTKQRLEKLGRAKQRSTHWLLQQAVQQYLEIEEYEERLKQETLDRWQEALDGKLISNEKVQAWLGTWGTDNKTDSEE